MLELHNGRRVGHVVGLWRYPVKSMAGQALGDIDVSWNGFAGDRRWAFVRNDVVSSGFPWLTLRERADMSHYVPAFSDPQRPDKSTTVVRTPSGAVFDVTDPRLRAELGGAHLIRQDRGVFDTFPLSLISTATIAHLGDAVGARLDVRRFRPNILVATDDAEPFAEDAWVGRVLRIGTLRLRIDKRDGRCVVITIDPDTTQRDPSILRTVARERQGCLGVYASTIEPGRIALGDALVIESGGDAEVVAPRSLAIATPLSRSSPCT